VRPRQPDVVLDEWARASRGRIDELLRESGAILFRGFPLRSPAAFERFAEAASGGLFADYGDLPRESLGDKIYGSTPYPKEEAILFHNESSHLPRWPLRIFFHCVTPAASGGETPLLDCRSVYREMDPGVRDKFERLGLTYVRHFISGLDVSWQDFFKTADRQAVERQCRELGIACSWAAGGDLRTVQRRPAVVVHPVTGDKLFFNQVQLHHPACLPARVRADLLALCGSPDRLPRNVAYGDGSPIEEEVVQDLSRLYQRLAAVFPWQAGDVVLLDNMAVAHARRPYTGERKILVAMGALTDGRAA
jgi:alpha-ketoglutarate-dependent taurine dioxygenase